MLNLLPGWRVPFIQGSKMTYPFANIDLARRLERTEARSNADFVEARARAFPDRGATWIEVAGAYAIFDGVGSPLTQTFGLGVFQETVAADLHAIEDFFKSRGGDVFHAVSPITSHSSRALARFRQPPARRTARAARGTFGLLRSRAGL